MINSKYQNQKFHQNIKYKLFNVIFKSFIILCVILNFFFKSNQKLYYKSLIFASIYNATLDSLIRKKYHLIDSSFRILYFTKIYINNYIQNFH